MAELVGAVEIYLYIGVAVAAVFLTVGVGRVDASASGSYFFRAVAFPGVVVLWPVVLLRWLQLEMTAGDR